MHQWSYGASTGYVQDCCNFFSRQNYWWEQSIAKSRIVRCKANPAQTFLKMYLSWIDGSETHPSRTTKSTWFACSAVILPSIGVTWEVTHEHTCSECYSAGKSLLELTGLWLNVIYFSRLLYRSSLYWFGKVHYNTFAHEGLILDVQSWCIILE